MSNPMDRSGRAPNALGLTGTAGLQLKKPAKKFGLQKPKQAARPASGSVFGDAAVEDSLDVSEELERMRQSKSARAAAEAEHQAAISQDASIFDYDGAYDAMQEQRKQARELTMGKSSQQKSAKYIGTIMEAHKERQIENDKIFERKLVKEAEAEAHLYGDKEKFITAAYRKKMQAREQFEAEQKAKEAKEEREDVTKRKDLSHFYSNLLHGNVGEVTAPSASRDAAYAASSGGKAAGAVAPREDEKLEFSPAAKKKIEWIYSRYPTREAALLPVLRVAEAEFESGNEEQNMGLNVSQEFDQPVFEDQAEMQGLSQQSQGFQQEEYNNTQPVSVDIDQQEELPADNGEDDEDGESVYMIDGVVMQKIQIEGEPDQFLMDP